MSALTNVDVTQRPQNPFKHLLGIDDHIAALDIFNEVRIKLFGIKLQNGWRKILKKNCWKHQRKLNITKPLNVHILAANVEDFINKYVNDRGLGYFSQQTIKTVHAKFQQ